MRPLIDATNLSHSREFIIYYSRRAILGRILLIAGAFVGCIYFYMQNQLLGVSVLFCLFIFQIPLLIKSIKTIDEIQFRINSKGIQYKDNLLIPWSNIENEKAVWEYKDDGDDGTQYFIYCIVEPSQIMKFDLAGLSTDISELNIVLTIQRNRFKKENNIL